MNNIEYRQNQLILQILFENKKLSEHEINIIKKMEPQQQNIIINRLIGVDK